MKKSIGLLGVTAAAALALFGAPAMATAAEVCTEEVTVTETTYNIETWTETAPAVPTVPAVPATPHEGLLEVPGGWAEDTISTGWTGTIADLAGGLDIDADPIQYVGLHIITPEGNLVYEEEPSYGGKLWSTTAAPGVPAGMGYASFGSVDEFVAAGYGGIAVTDVVVLYTHPDASSTIVSSVTIGGDVITFAEGTPGSPEIPGTPAVYEWVVTGSGQAAVIPADTEGVRYVDTGDVDVVTEVEVECPAVVVPPTEEPIVSAPADEETPSVISNTSSEDELAETGFDAMWLPWVALGAVLIGAATIIGRKVARSRR